MRHRTNNHSTRIRCKDVAASFARHRAELVEAARAEGATVLVDDGKFFHAERFDCSRSRIVYLACPHYVPLSPSIIRRNGPVQYETVFLPKVAA